MPRKETKMDINEKEVIQKRSRTNALYLLLKRISYIKEYRDAKNYYKQIDKEYYSKNLVKETNIIQKISFFLFLKNLFLLLYVYLTIINKVLYKMNNSEKFVEI